MNEDPKVGDIVVAYDPWRLQKYKVIRRCPLTPLLFDLEDTASKERLLSQPIAHYLVNQTAEEVTAELITGVPFWEGIFNEPE